ncbi:thiol reductant ABC exporter subunit CydC [Aeromicrobium sp. CTD01-1L150]|uniref:thiol reductant ABC exporter subunit CydC n=1 Tax=Aeromicrobium sp. CTD01-1L150 TaxID=3341830 RepID=UPI0035C1E8DD
MRGRLVLGFALAAAAQMSSVALLLTSGWLIVRAAEQPPVLYLLVAVTSVRMFGVTRAAARYAERLLTHDVALERAVDTRVAAYRALERVAPAGLAGVRHGDVVHRVVQDVERSQDRLLRIRLPWVSSVATVTVVVAVTAWLLPSVGLVLGVQAVLVAAVVRWWVPRVVRRVQAPTDLLAGGATELARVAPDLLAYGSSRGRCERAHDAVDALSRRGRHDAWTQGAGTSLVLTSTAVALALAVALTAMADIPAVFVGVLVLAPIGLAEVLDQLVEAERHRPVVEGAERRLTELQEMPVPIEEPADPVPAPPGAELELEGLAVGWGGSTVASGLSARLPAGEVLLVTGPSGSGKSTVAVTLLRLLSPVAGRVRLGGVDVSMLRGVDVRRRIGLLAQDEAVFDTTIRENLRIADPGADDDALRRALERAGLLGFVDSLPEGLDTPVGEGGGRLSGGERQRLGLARLLLAEHDVLVLDEPTEHLDEPTAQALLDDLADLTPEHSLVVITHSPTVLERFAGAGRLRVESPAPLRGSAPEAVPSPARS